MADNAEKKNIAKLDFNVSDAKNNLDEVAKKLENLSNNSEKAFQKIEKNFGKAFTGGDYSKQIKEMQDKLLKFEQLSQKNQEKITVSLNKEINKRYSKHLDYQEKMAYSDKKTANEQILIDAKKNAKIEMQNNQHANKMEEINARQAKSVETLYDKIIQYAKTYVIYRGFNALKRGIKETIDEMVEVEQQMVAIDRVMNITNMDVNAFRNDLIQLAYDYGNSFNNVADISLRLAQAGEKGRDNLALTEKTLLALNTAELDATQATDDMVAIMSQWGLMTGTAEEKAENYGNIIDKVNKVADNFPITSADMMDALKKVSSAFNLAGASIDETIALIVAAEKSSQRGGKVIGTALSNIVQQIKAEGKLNLAEEMGLNFYTDETKTQFKNVIDIFKEMAERMQVLKDAGKESSVEMQSLLELFTVFRRNIGASLLGEMSGEDNTYLQALETSINSVGYSLQENEKYMRTAKAAQEQFNAELLKLKTQVWEGGLEQTFRDMLSMGTDLIKGIGDIINKFGILPTTIGTVVAAYTVLNNKIKVQDIISLTKKITAINSAIKETGTALNSDNKLLEGTSASFKKYVTSVDSGKVSLAGYGKELVLNTAKTAALTAGTIALNAAISFGLSAAITAIISLIDNWIHAQEKAVQKNNELKQKAEETASKINQEITSVQELTKEYNEFSNKIKNSKDENKLIDVENVNKAYELQAKINEAIKDSGKQVNLVKETTNEYGEKVQQVNTKYEEQLNLLKTIAFEKKKEETRELKAAMELAKQNVVGVNTAGKTIGWTDSYSSQLSRAGIDKSFGGENQPYTSSGFTGEGRSVQKDYFEFLNTLSPEKQLKTLKEWSQQLDEAASKGENVGDVSKYVKEKLDELQSQYDEVSKATQNYSNSLSELYAMSGQVDSFNTFLDSIASSYNLEGPQKLIQDLQNINQEFSDGQINIEEYFNKIQEKISEIDLTKEGEELEAYQAIFAATTESLAEGISTLNAGLESGTINFADYSSGIKEAAENMLQLRAEQENLQLVDGVWQNASGQVDEYANSLQNAIDELSDMGDLLNTLAENYDYIAENANMAGEAMFKQSQVGTEAYTNLANSVASSLNKMKNDNNAAYNAITAKVFESMGKSANEVTNADTYITETLNGNAQALNAALNEAANQVSISTNRVTVSMGNVLTQLGNAISNFKYNIKATPYITGGFGLQKDKNGLPTGIKLPTFGFDITGTGGDSIQNLGTSLSTFGSDLSSLGTNQFRYSQLKSVAKPYTPSGSPYSGGGGTSSSGTGGGGSGGSSRNSSSDNTKAEEDAYKIRLKNFKDYISEQERLEKRWVDKQKELGLLSNEDYLYITQQRIERYKKYLEEVKNATWMNEEDKLALEKEYNEKIEDLQLDYLQYLKNKETEDINKLKQNSKEKIQAIKDEASERIDALKKVDNENDRIRKKEEYEKKRQEHLNDISYWEQRTGREAQEALKEAKKNLQELDEEWQEQLEDWSIDDQIKAIEAERDAQIKATEEAQEAEIKGIEKVYDEKAKRFAETGEIIYEGSVIQSKKLYNQYKTNFIDPISNDLKNLNKAEKKATTTPTPEPKKQEQQYETYLIKRGDTLSAIARRYGTTVDKIMAANPYIKNRNLIYTGNTLQIPKFHEGGIVGGNVEGFALLKPKEVVLKPEWAEGINKLAQMARTKDNPITNNSTVVEVKGNLVHLDAKIDNRTDADYVVKKVEKVLKDKFNIKK